MDMMLTPDGGYYGQPLGMDRPPRFRWLAAFLRWLGGDTAEPALEQDPHERR
jgi:hypothetical protein